MESWASDATVGSADVGRRSQRARRPNPACSDVDWLLDASHKMRIPSEGGFLVSGSAGSGSPAEADATAGSSSGAGGSAEEGCETVLDSVGFSWI